MDARRLHPNGPGISVGLALPPQHLLVGASEQPMVSPLWGQLSDLTVMGGAVCGIDWRSDHYSRGQGEQLGSGLGRSSLGDDNRGSSSRKVGLQLGRRQGEQQSVQGSQFSEKGTCRGNSLLVLPGRRGSGSYQPRISWVSGQAPLVPSLSRPQSPYAPIQWVAPPGEVVD